MDLIADSMPWVISWEELGLMTRRRMFLLTNRVVILEISSAMYRGDEKYDIVTRK